MSRRSSFRRHHKPEFAERAKEHCRQLTAFMFSNVGIILLVVLYTTAGAFLFQQIERDEALNRTTQFLENRKQLKKDLWILSCCEENTFNETAFKIRLNQSLTSYQEKYVKLAKKGGGNGDEWSFPGAFLYSLTVITTIGYGNISPKTNGGKITTILYAIIGMPLFLLYLSNIGDVLAKLFKWIYAKLCLCRVCPGVARRRAIREKRKKKMSMNPDNDNDNGDDSFYKYSMDVSSMYSQGRGEYSGDDGASSYQEDGFDDQYDDDDNVQNQSSIENVTVPLTTCVIIMIFYVLFGATLFGTWEDWKILEGSYFCFISLSSIGFGDMVPGNKVLEVDSSESVVKTSFILCAVYLLLGMALIAMCFNLMQEQVMHKTYYVKRVIKRCFHCGRLQKKNFDFESDPEPNWDTPYNVQ